VFALTQYKGSLNAVNRTGGVVERWPYYVIKAKNWSTTQNEEETNMALAPAPWRLQDLTPEVIPAADGSIRTIAAQRDGSRPGGDSSGDSDPVGLIFSETFNSLPDITSADGMTDALTAAGWTTMRNGGAGGGPHYTPAEGFANGHYPYEIKGDDSEQIMEDGEKSLVCYRESYSLNDGSAGWNSDGILMKIFDEGKESVFVRFYIKFQPGWTEAGQTKIFRWLSLDEDGSPTSFFSDGDSAPIYLWDWATSSYGVRHFHSFRADPQGDNYFMTNPSPQGLPRSMSQGDLTANYDGNIRDLNGDGTEDNTITLIDQKTGETLTAGENFHDQIFGSAWHKVEIYLSMNSSPGAKDGEMKYWLDDQLCFFNEQMPWMGDDSPGGRLWNAVGIGGNDNFNTYPNSEAVQEWYAISKIEIFDTLPEGM